MVHVQAPAEKTHIFRNFSGKLQTIFTVDKKAVWGRHSQGAPLSASPIKLFQQNRIAHNYILKQNSIARIYFSRTTSRVYISAEQRRPYIHRQNSIVCSYTHPGSGDTWEWRPITG